MNRRPLVIAMVGAAATLLVVGLLLGIPAADRCAPTGRGLWDCVRDGFTERYLHREAAVTTAPPVPAAPMPPLDLLAGEPAGPPVTFELADVADTAAIVAQDLPAPPRAMPQPARPDMAEQTELAETPPAVTAPPAAVEPPGIDTIAFDGSGLVSGTGPEGATIRLFLDGQPAGETSVEAGRWSVENVDLGAQLKQGLRVDAVDPATGQVLGSSSFTIEIDLPDDPPAGPEPLLPDPEPSALPIVEDGPPAPLPVREFVPPDLIADMSPDAFPPELLTRHTPRPAAPPVEADPPATPTEVPMTVAAEAAAPPVAKPAAAAPKEKKDVPKRPKQVAPGKAPAIPPLRPVKPRKVSPSVTILEGGGGGSITTLGN